MKIVICGGGTAGWLAAYIISHQQPGVHEIEVIESSSIGIIGAGEGSTGIMYDLLMGKFFDPKTTIEDFMSSTSSTRKLGISHKNWTNVGSQYFAPLDGSWTYNTSPDYVFNHVLHSFGQDKLHVASPIGFFYDRQSVPPMGGAFHFDGHEVGKFFKKLSEKMQVKHLDEKVVEVFLKSDGRIDYLLTESNKIISGDFFIDASGFSRILMKKLEIEWVSYKDFLPLDTAIPFISKYESDENPEPYTSAEALSSGWMWNIPLQTRRGCGYVYCSDFMSEDQALNEVQKYVGKPVDPIKIIKFDAGRGKVFWEKNCISIGLSAAFSEPLEATSIHSTIMQLLIFCFEFLDTSLERTDTDVNKKLYNQKISRLYDDFRDFISVHYQGGREDSDFWMFVKNELAVPEFTQEILELCENRIPSSLVHESHFGSSSPGWNWILSGINRLSRENARRELEISNSLEKAKSIFDEYVLSMSSIHN